MAETRGSPHVSGYLRDLDVALVSVPHDIAGEIRRGIAEELIGLSPEDAHERITQLGDPRFIASEAAARADFDDAPIAARSPIRGSRTYAVIAAVVLAVGAFLVPLVGWAIGYVLVGVSTVWRRWEKIVAAAVPLGLTALVAGYIVLVGSASASSAGGSPWLVLLPMVVSNAAIALAISNAAAGVWLLVRALLRP